jgi:hypothetical protein
MLFDGGTHFKHQLLLFQLWLVRCPPLNLGLAQLGFPRLVCSFLWVRRGCFFGGKYFGLSEVDGKIEFLPKIAGKLFFNTLLSR